MKNKLMIITIVITLCSMLVGCSGSGGSTALKEGGIYSFKNNNGAYSVLKILKVESGGLHIRVYSNQFDSPPTKVDESTLYMAGRNPKPNEILSEPDVALLKKSFDNYKATFVQQSTVKDDELEVYKTWKQAGGQYY
ncbi:MAG TPA: hypothetical protein VF430_09335 [Verrucomicrobiae bacterium]